MALAEVTVVSDLLRPGVVLVDTPGTGSVFGHDEELRRISQLISAISPGCVLLCNKPFASTNEREGSNIGGHVFVPLAGGGAKEPAEPALATGPVPSPAEERGRT